MAAIYTQSCCSDADMAEGRRNVEQPDRKQDENGEVHCEISDHCYALTDSTTEELLLLFFYFNGECVSS